MTVLLLAIWWFARWQAKQTNPATIQTQIEREFQVQNQLFGFVDVVGKLAFGLTAYLAWQNLELLRHQKVIAEKKQLAERFSKAVEMLGAQQNPYLQTGGLYALERIALDHYEDYYWTVVEVLTAFIRGSSPIIQNVTEQPKADPEIHTAFRILFQLLPRRTEEQEKLDVNLTKVNLSGIVLTGHGNLNKVYFNHTCFDKAFLNSVEMCEARCMGATFHKANLAGGRFHKTDFTNVSFQDADLDGAHFKGTQFARADFTNASVYEADFCQAFSIKPEKLQAEAKNGETAIFEGSSKTTSITGSGEQSV